jgi:hypothetical protein
MEIINERREINLKKWMEKVKDFRSFFRWGYRYAPN